MSSTPHQHRAESERSEDIEARCAEFREIVNNWDFTDDSANRLVAFLRKYHPSEINEAIRLRRSPQYLAEQQQRVLVVEDENMRRRRISQSWHYRFGCFCLMQAVACLIVGLLISLCLVYELAQTNPPAAFILLAGVTHVLIRTLRAALGIANATAQLEPGAVMMGDRLSLWFRCVWDLSLDPSEEIAHGRFGPPSIEQAVREALREQ